jgi:hypothetical protein
MSDVMRCLRMCDGRDNRLSPYMSACSAVNLKLSMTILLFQNIATV